MENEKRVLWSELGSPLMSRYILHFKAKISSNRALIAGQNEASHEKPPQPRDEGLPRPWLPPRAGRGEQHGPWQGAHGRASQGARPCALWLSSFCRLLACLFDFQLFCFSFYLIMPMYLVLIVTQYTP